MNTPLILGIIIIVALGALFGVYAPLILQFVVIVLAFSSLVYFGKDWGVDIIPVSIPLILFTFGTIGGDVIWLIQNYI